MGKLYPVSKSLNGELVIYSDGGKRRTDKILNDVNVVDFELNEEIKMLEFKEGQVYEYLEANCLIFDIGQHLTVQSDNTGCHVLSNVGMKWYAHEFNEGDLRLVEDSKEVAIPLDKGGVIEKPVFINVENLMEHIIINKLEVNEILSYLDGYVEGSRF